MGVLDTQPQVIKFSSCFAQGRWFFPASSTTKTGRHDIAEILLKVKTPEIKSINNRPITNISGLTPFSTVRKC
jgi:hypothetical protein